MDKKLKHLELIQGVVNRLSTNSFLLKGWSVVLLSALLALSAHNSKMEFIYLAYIPTIIFWGLDGYFLWQERLYRDLYNHVRKKEPSEIDFSMDTSIVEDGSSGWINAVMSKTLIPFHGVLITAILIVMFIQI